MGTILGDAIIILWLQRGGKFNNFFLLRNYSLFRSLSKSQISRMSPAKNSELIKGNY